MFKQFTTKKYHTNLLGESLEDLLRKATAKTLDQPDEVANAQVVQAINEDTTHHPRDIVALLNRRLEMENPQKQYLAVILLTKVMQECQGMVGLYQEELLHEVAQIMARPSRSRDAPASQRAKGAARDLLRSYGRTGYDAIRNAARANYAGARAATPTVVPTGEGGVAVPAGVEQASLVDEVNRMVETGRGHTELLQDMLVNSAEPGVQEMEHQLMMELLQEVRELRAMFTPYLEQLGALEGAEVEATMGKALEAVDMLDNAIALQREVAVAVAEAPPQAAQASTSSSTVFSPPAPMPPTPTSPAAAPSSRSTDLIDLSDLGDSLPSPAAAPGSPVAPPPRDPFAPVSSPLSPSPPTPSPISLAPLNPSPLNPAPLNPVQSAPHPPPSMSPPPPPTLTQQISYPNYPQQNTGGMRPQYPQYPQYPPSMPQYPPQYPPSMQQPMAPYSYPTGGLVQSPTASPPMSPNTMYPRPMMSPMYQVPPMGPPHPQQGPPMYAPAPINPFAPQMQQGMSPPMGFGDNAFAPPPQAFSPTSMSSPNNPFAASSPNTASAQPAPAASIDREWDLLFADKNKPNTAQR